MSLPKDMPTRDPERVPDSDRHRTDYRGSQGGWAKDADKPVPGAKKS
ncbi:MAG: hypothetical protein WCD21_40355 [Streptomyces sp.]